MKKHIGFVLICMISTGYLHAQTAEDSVKIAIGQFFTYLRNSDSKGILSCFTDSAILQTIARDKEGEAVVKNEKIADFATLVGTIPKLAADERIVFDFVKVDGPLATAWTPFKFYYNGVFSHCGVNSFQMIRIRGQWKIHFLIDTRRKQACD
ncbi:MAG: hypothetical protein KGO92_00715 [Bacteroidota bacterium]|nr:hypothetical protein [Bacteroidota bacterium]